MSFKFTEAQETWLQALESGKYEQGKAFLNKDNKFCCLGVACEIFKDEVGLSTGQRKGATSYVDLKQEKWHDDFGELVDFQYTSWLPPVMAEFLNLRSDVGIFENENGFVIYIDGFTNLASMNDNGVSFAQIAKYIRDNPEKVFKNVE